ncbi:MAG: DUF5682 family protein [Chloroflexota bacterium]
MTVHLFGIRHHGPGSARSLQQALEDLSPDIVLIEGPPDAAEILPLAAHPQMKPPVALLIYKPDEPKNAVYYPFATYSPEWQALRYGLKRNLPVRFMDLPQAYRLGVPLPEPSVLDDTPDEIAIRQDPLQWVAMAAGYSDSERWWDHMVEQRQNRLELFTAIQTLMTELRAEAPPETELLEQQREAFMRQIIRQAQKEGFTRIAVVCGAWHVPALATMPTIKSDKALLKGLRKRKVAATWVPWTYSRLAYQSGYGAGIESPGWYEHLWKHSDNIATHWISTIAQLLRREDLDASPDHIIETVRLAEALAALRDRPIPGLPELMDATKAVFCFNSDAPMQLIQEKLLINDQLGQVPDKTPMLPIQQDLKRWQKKVRLKPTLGIQTQTLDLRKPLHLDRSHLLHRLNILEIPWGKTEHIWGKRGSFHEAWKLLWNPEFPILLVEANIWGNTIEIAATHYARHQAEHSEGLSELTKLVQQVLLANLPDAVQPILVTLDKRATLTNDIGHLMAALPALINLLRYGNVRKTDRDAVQRVVNSLVTRICVGLPAACISLDTDQAQDMLKRLNETHPAIALLQNEALKTLWSKTLTKLTEQVNLHPLLGGRCSRLLLDQGQWSIEKAERALRYACSTAYEPGATAFWLEGFLQGSGLLLLHNDTLWGVIDRWLATLPAETFLQLLPFLRRAFATFTPPERRQMGEQAQRAQTTSLASTIADDRLNKARANLVLPILGQMLGIDRREKKNN